MFHIHAIKKVFQTGFRTDFSDIFWTRSLDPVLEPNGFPKGPQNPPKSIQIDAQRPPKHDLKKQQQKIMDFGVSLEPEKGEISL